jgi:hypothetical protein
LEETMTTTDFNRDEIERPAEPGSIGAGAEIYRRMERRSKGRPMWMMAAPVAVLALAAAGGVVAYESMKPHATPAPVQAQSAPAAAPQVAATTPPPAAQPAQVAEATPTPASPAPVAHVVRHERERPVIAPVAHKRTARDANAASSAGEDTSAYTPAPQHPVNPAPAAVRPVQAQPAPVQPAAPQPAAPVTHNFAPPTAVNPAPTSVTPPPAPATATPTGQP